MNLKAIVKNLEGLSNAKRYEAILQILDAWDIDYSVQEYATGKNILIESNHKDWVGVSSHFDVVPHSAGANDNASAIAVCLDILRRMQEFDFNSFGVSVFFFDEEETGLKGSKAYVSEFGTKGMIGLMNLEMVGQGDKFALWSLNEQSKGKVLEGFELTAQKEGIFSRRFDKIITNYADHMSFLQGGMKDAFSITCISQKDLEVAYHYYKAQEFDVDIATLQEIMKQAPLFEHYHQPTDLSIHLSENSLQMCAEVIWKTLLYLDKR
jgi:Zn-dependent M28 family amino/carboxypeptidase